MGAGVKISCSHHNFDRTDIPIREQGIKNNCDIVYTPTVEDLYGNEIKSKEYDLGEIMTIMEGKFRPGHFDGMVTVVEKFFNIIKPSKAFFGQKDLQQLQIIQKLVKQMPLNIEIISGKTIRDKNGLALSSRNKLLNTSEKQNARHIYKSLQYLLFSVLSLGPSF